MNCEDANDLNELPHESGCDPSRIYRMLCSSDSGDNLEALRELVCALLVEVEALRAKATIDADGDIERSTYARAYRATALLSHDSTGPTSGLYKLLKLWFDDRLPRSPAGKPLRELVMLRRLGCTAQDAARYVDEARSAEMRT